MVQPEMIAGLPAKEYHRRKDAERYRIGIRRFIDYLGGRCAVCGATEDLEIDHRDPATKRYNVSRRWKETIEAVKDELDRCQLLCKVDHAAKTAEQREKWQHGTIHGYQNQKCRCDPCKAVQAAYMKEFRRRRKLRLAEQKATGPQPPV